MSTPVRDTRDSRAKYLSLTFVAGVVAATAITKLSVRDVKGSLLSLADVLLIGGLLFAYDYLRGLTILLRSELQAAKTLEEQIESRLHHGLRLGAGVTLFLLALRCLFGS